MLDLVEESDIRDFWQKFDYSEQLHKDQRHLASSRSYQSLANECTTLISSLDRRIPAISPLFQDLCLKFVQIEKAELSDELKNLQNILNQLLHTLDKTIDILNKNEDLIDAALLAHVGGMQCLDLIGKSLERRDLLGSKNYAEKANKYFENASEFSRAVKKSNFDNFFKGEAHLLQAYYLRALSYYVVRSKKEILSDAVAEAQEACNYFFASKDPFMVANALNNIADSFSAQNDISSEISNRKKALEHAVEGFERCIESQKYQASIDASEQVENLCFNLYNWEISNGKLSLAKEYKDKLLGVIERLIKLLEDGRDIKERDTALLRKDRLVATFMVIEAKIESESRRSSICKDAEIILKMLEKKYCEEGEFEKAADVANQLYECYYLLHDSIAAYDSLSRNTRSLREQHTKLYDEQEFTAAAHVLLSAAPSYEKMIDMIYNQDDFTKAEKLIEELLTAYDNAVVYAESSNNKRLGDQIKYSRLIAVAKYQIGFGYDSKEPRSKENRFHQGIEAAEKALRFAIEIAEYKEITDAIKIIADASFDLGLIDNVVKAYEKSISIFSELKRNADSESQVLIEGLILYSQIMRSMFLSQTKQLVNDPSALQELHDAQMKYEKVNELRIEDTDFLSLMESIDLIIAFGTSSQSAVASVKAFNWALAKSQFQQALSIAERFDETSRKRLVSVIGHLKALDKWVDVFLASDLSTRIQLYTTALAAFKENIEKMGDGTMRKQFLIDVLAADSGFYSLLSSQEGERFNFEKERAFMEKAHQLINEAGDIAIALYPQLSDLYSGLNDMYAGHISSIDVRTAHFKDLNFRTAVVKAEEASAHYEKAEERLMASRNYKAAIFVKSLVKKTAAYKGVLTAASKKLKFNKTSKQIRVDKMKGLKELSVEKFLSLDDDSISDQQLNGLKKYLERIREKKDGKAEEAIKNIIEVMTVRFMQSSLENETLVKTDSSYVNTYHSLEQRRRTGLSDLRRVTQELRPRANRQRSIR